MLHRSFHRCALPALLLILALTGCAVNDRQVINQAADEHKALSPAVIQDSELANYFQQVGDRIIDVAKELDAQHVGPASHFSKGEENQWMFSNRMQFHLVNSKTLNAFTTGGEHMYIYNQLFQGCTSEDELAAVMAHEYGHVYCRHVAQGMQHQMTTLIAGALVGGAAGYALGSSDDRTTAVTAGAGVGAAAGQFVNMGYTRKDEAQADEYGFKFFTRAGWDPRHFADFFRQMIKQGLDTTPAIASDHPTLASRVKIADQRVKDLGPDVDRFHQPPIANAQRFAQLKARAAQLGKTLPDDKSLANSQQLLQALPRSCVAPVDPDDAVQARKSLANQAQAAQQNQASNQSSKKKKQRTSGDDVISR